MKNVFQLFIFISLFTLNISAQNNAKWNIGAEYSVDNLSVQSGNNYLITNENYNGTPIQLDKDNYSFGITSSYLIKEKISLSSGILYSNKDLTRRYNCGGCDYIGIGTGNSIGTLQYNPPIETKQRFLVIPIGINYKFLTGKFKPTISGGFKNNFLVKSDLKEDSKKYFLETFIGASVYYNLFRKWEAGIGYKYQVGLTDVYKNDEFRLKANSVFFKINYNL